ncbi:uncharacterized protein Dana_GF26471, isoform B [Drosophila ananassae]|uniref:Uncharacterized protein, isoform B n=1 Tax=Drosophila ananassae TaxID=7217 RepID=A0A0N8NZ54_DROAN|nr:uncharacterized protein LOC26513880 isoform X2 [Drosophila ananassae]KPU73372.1 uncharacterized protein Dana_GF26471, isoform B [Drosophila ananassae]
MPETASVHRCAHAVHVVIVFPGVACVSVHQVEHHRPPPSDGATGSCPTLGDNFKLVNPLWRTWIRMHEELSAGPGA